MREQEETKTKYFAPKAMMDSNLGKEEKRNKLKIAIAKQTKVTKENIFGEGVDVPLLGKYKAM